MLVGGIKRKKEGRVGGERSWKVELINSIHSIENRFRCGRRSVYGPFMFVLGLRPPSRLCVGVMPGRDKCSMLERTLLALEVKAFFCCSLVKVVFAEKLPRG